MSAEDVQKRPNRPTPPIEQPAGYRPCLVLTRAHAATRKATLGAAFLSRTVLVRSSTVGERTGCPGLVVRNRSAPVPDEDALGYGPTTRQRTAAARAHELLDLRREERIAIPAAVAEVACKLGVDFGVTLPVVA